MMFRLPSVSGIAVSFVLRASLVSAYSFVFTNNPQQCTTLSLQINGSGVPPYSVLIVPYGPSPLANNVEVRTVISQQFPGDTTTLGLPLNYPAGSQFVAVVSDSSGFGTGSTSGVMTVASSTDSGCFNSTQSIHPDFFYNLSPNQLSECNASMLWWDPSTVQGNVNVQGVIPGGKSFSVPVGTLTNVPGNAGIGFNWTPALLAGTTVLVVVGDQRGLGTGGSVQFVVSPGPNSLCITNSTTGGGGSKISSKEIAAIVGGSVGGIVALGLVVFFIRRNSNKTPNPDRERTDDLLHGYSGRSKSPQPRHPVPFGPFPDEPPETSYIVTSPTISSSFSHSKAPSMTHSALDPGVRYATADSTLLSDTFTGSPTQGTTSLNRRSGATSFSDPPSPTRPDPAFGLGMLPEEYVTMEGSSSLPKQPTLTVLRPFNIIQHEDAHKSGGPSKDTRTVEPETIELPPAYTNIS